MSVAESDHLKLGVAEECAGELFGSGRAAPDQSSKVQVADFPYEEIDLSIHGYYHAVLHLLSATVRALKPSLPETDISLSERCLNLLYVWAHGIDLRCLEFDVSKETGLQEIVAELIADIARALSLDVFIGHDIESRTSVIEALPNFLKRHTNQEEFSEDRLSEDVSEDHEIRQDISNQSVASTELDDDEASDSKTTSDDESTPPPDLTTRSQPNESPHSEGTRATCQGNEAEHSLEPSNVKAAFIGIHDCVEALMNLLPTIDNCCKEQSAEYHLQDDPVRAPHDVYLTDEAQPFITRILDKFPLIDEKLAQRTGRANWERYVRLRSQEEHAVGDSSRFEEQATHSIFRPYTEFQDSGLGASVLAKTAYAKTDASHDSFMSVLSTYDQGTIRVPDPPAAVSAGVPFKCEICHSLLADMTDHVKWKLHVFADLQPYICTFEKCTKVNLTFSTRKQWAAHEFSQHRWQRLWHCSRCLQNLTSEVFFLEHLTEFHSEQHDPRTESMHELIKAAETHMPCQIKSEKCPYCLADGFTSKRAFTTHVCRHMEEVALAVLPFNSDGEETPRSIVDLDFDDSELAGPATRGQRGCISEAIERPCPDPNCDAKFLREIDLVKHHEKTHIYPFKSPVESCRYHDLGLLTGEERASHMTSKHDPNPPLFACMYCKFEAKSKLERQQHMKKEHGGNLRQGKRRNSGPGSLSGQMSFDLAGGRPSVSNSARQLTVFDNQTQDWTEVDDLPLRISESHFPHLMMPTPFGAQDTHQEYGIFQGHDLLTDWLDNIETVQHSDVFGNTATTSFDDSIISVTVHEDSLSLPAAHTDRVDSLRATSESDESE